MVKHLPAMEETWVQSLGWKDPLEKGMATHSSGPPWRIPWTEETGRLQSMGSQKTHRTEHTQHTPYENVLFILQARMLEWVAVLSCRGFSQPRD